MFNVQHGRFGWKFCFQFSPCHYMTMPHDDLLIVIFHLFCLQNMCKCFWIAGAKSGLTKKCPQGAVLLAVMHFSCAQKRHIYGTLVAVAPLQALTSIIMIRCRFIAARASSNWKTFSYSKSETLFTLSLSPFGEIASVVVYHIIYAAACAWARGRMALKAVKWVRKTKSSPMQMRRKAKSRTDWC